jgi:hypothetical protein
MARLAGGGGIADFVFTVDPDTSDMAPAAGGTVITFWDALAGGNQYTGRPDPDDGTGLTDGAGNPVDSVSLDSDGFLPASGFMFPDIALTGVTRMAADANGGAGPRQWIYPNDPLGPALQAQQAAAANSAQISQLNAQAPAFNYYNPLSAAYPPRPTTGMPVWWVGPTPPAFGGSFAVDGLDYWIGPQS